MKILCQFVFNLFHTSYFHSKQKLEDRRSHLLQTTNARLFLVEIWKKYLEYSTIIVLYLKCWSTVIYSFKIEGIQNYRNLCSQEHSAALQNNEGSWTLQEEWILAQYLVQNCQYSCFPLKIRDNKAEFPPINRYFCSKMMEKIILITEFTRPRKNFDVAGK